METTTLRFSGASAEATWKLLPSARAVSCEASVMSTIGVGMTAEIEDEVVAAEEFWRTDIADECGVCVCV